MTTQTVWRPLPREEVVKAVERKGPSRIPLIMAKWWGQGLADQYGDQLKRFDRIPHDSVVVLMGNPVDPARMGLSWDWKRGGAHDASCVIDDWAKLDEFLEKLPKAAEDPRWEDIARQCAPARQEGLYLHFGWWNLFFERPWSLRGMQNLMVDYYTDPENVARLHKAMCGVYCDYIRTAAENIRPDGFWTSDDLGHQTGAMMSPAIFHDLIFPYYSTVGETLRDLRMHFWLHSCGNNTVLMEDLIAAGVDVFHPVQKHTMDEIATAEMFGDRISFLAGIDVQHTLQEKDPAGVRQEVRFLIDTFDRPEGGMCIAAGNGIVSGTPIENIEAFLDEALAYGQAHRERVGRA